MLKIEYRSLPGFEQMASLLTIHNMAYQGTFWHWDMVLTGLDWKYFNWRQMEFFGNLNLLKTGLVFADAINTVSPRYAEEIQTMVDTLVVPEDSELAEAPAAAPLAPAVERCTSNPVSLDELSCQLTSIRVSDTATALVPDGASTILNTGVEGPTGLGSQPIRRESTRSGVPAE